MIQLRLDFLKKGWNLALKDDIQGVSKELNSQEQFLESIIKSERFFKKHKKSIFSFVIFILIVFGLFFSIKTYKNANFEAASEAYTRLINNQQNPQDLEILKSKNPTLFSVYEFQINRTNKEKLEEILKNPATDQIIKKIIEFELGKNGDFMGDYNALMNGFKLLQQNKIDAANLEFAKISKESGLQGLANNLKHYQGKKWEKFLFFF